MANKLVHLRIPTNLYSESRSLAEKSGFGSIQEFIKSAMRSAVEAHRTQVIIAKLAALKGSEKGIKRMTREERNAFALEFMNSPPEERSKLFRELGLDK